MFADADSVLFPAMFAPSIYAMRRAHARAAQSADAARGVCARIHARVKISALPRVVRACYAFHAAIYYAGAKSARGAERWRAVRKRTSVVARRAKHADAMSQPQEWCVRSARVPKMSSRVCYSGAYRYFTPSRAL